MPTHPDDQPRLEFVSQKEPTAAHRRARDAPPVLGRLFFLAADLAEPGPEVAPDAWCMQAFEEEDG